MLIHVIYKVMSYVHSSNIRSHVVNAVM